MASSNNKSSTISPPLCAKACSFYGNEVTNGMCSKCYKDFLNLTKERLRLLEITGKPLNIKIAPATMSDDHKTNNDTSTNKKNKNRCECCNKRVGLTGFECRCGGLFCGLHRYAEEHSCNFDFKRFGRLQLEKQNTFCGGDKLLERA